jgi:hypothetical protein
MTRLQKRKACKLELRQLRAHFPASEQLVPECATCQLLKHDSRYYHCAFLAEARGKYVHPRHTPKRRIALLTVGVEAKGAIIPAGEQVLVDRQPNAGTHVWVTVRNPGFGRLGKFLVSRASLDFIGPSVMVLENGRVRKIERYAVHIADVWLPLKEVRGVWVDNQPVPAGSLKAGTIVDRVEIPEWLAQMKGLV